MTIPKAAAFAQQFGTGPNINRITNELTDYWTTIDNTNSTVNDCITAYRFLITTCQYWLKRKAGKSEFKASLLGGHTNYINNKFVNRRTAIAAIAETATRELMLMLEQNNLLNADLRGQLSFDLRKFHEKGNRIALRPNTKSLHEGYQQERQTYLSSGKTSAISGTQIHGMHGQQIPPKIQNSKLNGQQKTALKAVYTGGGGTAKDWKILSEIQGIGNLQVAFLKKSERYRYLAYIDNHLFVDANNQPLHHPGMVLWAMDRYGNMFVFDDNDVYVQTKIGQVNHSSMNAGNEVICAGMITVVNGQVTDITNTSGHYKPTATHLAESLVLLNREGLDLSQASIRTADFINPPSPNQCWWVTWDPARFIASNGMQGEVSREAGPRP